MVRCPRCQAPLAYEGAPCGACQARRRLEPGESDAAAASPVDVAELLAQPLPEVRWTEEGVEVLPTASSPPSAGSASIATATEATAAPRPGLRLGRVLLVALLIGALVFGGMYAWQVLPALQAASYALRTARADQEELYRRSTSVLASTRSAQSQLRDQGITADVDTVPGYLYRITYHAAQKVTPETAQIACLDTLAPLIRDWPDTAWVVSLYAGETRLCYTTYNPRTKQVQTAGPPQKRTRATPTTKAPPPRPTS